MSVLVRDIAYRPLPSQLRFHDCRSRFKLFSGAVGSGKSAALVQEMIRLSVVNAGCLGLIGAPTYKILHDTTQREWFRVLNENKIPYRFNKSDNECVLTDLGTHLIFRTLNEPENLVGTNLAFFGIDEMAFASEWAFLRLQARLRDPLARELCGVGSTTPNGLNWVYDYFFGGKLNNTFASVKSVPGENHYLPDDFYSSLAKSYDERFYRQEVLGQYLSLQSGTVYHAFDRAKHVNPAIVRRSDAQLWLCVDFNVDPMAWIVAQIVDNSPVAWASSRDTRAVEVLDEIVVRAGNIDLSCQAFATLAQKYRMSGRTLAVYVTGDPAGAARTHAGPSDYNLMKQFFAGQPDFNVSWYVATHAPAVRDRVNSMNAALYNARGEIKLTVHPACKTLINDFERMIWARDSHGNSLDGFDKRDKMLTHASDAIGYLIEKEFSASRMTSGGFKNDQRLI